MSNFPLDRFHAPCLVRFSFLVQYVYNVSWKPAAQLRGFFSFYAFTTLFHLINEFENTYNPDLQTRRREFEIPFICFVMIEGVDRAHCGPLQCAKINNNASNFRTCINPNLQRRRPRTTPPSPTAAASPSCWSTVELAACSAPTRSQQFSEAPCGISRMRAAARSSLTPSSSRTMAARRT